MQKLTIDLLPEEFKQTQIKRSKFYKIQYIGIWIIMLTAFLASLLVALRILQSQTIVQVQSRAKEAETRMSQLTSTQGYLLLLKNRLSTINQYLGIPSRQAQMYNLIGKLLPPSVSISSIAVDKGGEVLILATSSDGGSLDLFINSLLSKDTNEDKIKEINMESLSRGRDGIYRLSFKIKPK